MKDESFSADSRLIQALVKRSIPVACSEGRTLFNQGDTPDGVFILERGEAALLMKSDAGRIVMCLKAGSGSLLGLPGVISKEPYSLMAIIRKNSTVSFISREDFGRTIQEEPGLYPSVLKVLAAEVRFARGTLAKD
jgi:CRP-like cAMP-binding protein